MATRQRRTTQEVTDRGPTRKRERSETEKRKSLNERRREKYQQDAEYRDKLKRQQRERYRVVNAIDPNDIITELQREGEVREIYANDVDPITAEVFTLREAAEALGTSLVTLRSWISGGSVPHPIYRDTTYHYYHYSVGELEVILGILAEHNQHYKYLRSCHTDTIKRIADEVQEYRSNYI